MSEPIESNWWWPLLLAVLLVLLVQNLWRAQAQGVIEMRTWEVKRSERPGAFWFTVATEAFFLIACVGFLAKWLLEQF